MRNLPKPTLDAQKYYQLISSEKRGFRSRQLALAKNKVCVAYVEYLAKAHDFASLIPIDLPSTRKKALVHAYSSRTKSLTVMRDYLLAPEVNDFDECPYCGIGEPLTLDHYVPKETHPEFAILPANLVPLCHACNTVYKRDQFLCAGGNRIFIHSYFDTIPAYSFIRASIDSTGTETIVSFKINHDPANADFSLVLERQFLALNLAERFFKKSASMMSRNSPTFQRFFKSGGGARLAMELRALADGLRPSRTSNHWEVALIDALAASAEFCGGGFVKPIRRG